jgi:hypothetical protein
MNVVLADLLLSMKQLFFPRLAWGAVKDDQVPFACGAPIHIRPGLL